LLSDLEQVARTLGGLAVASLAAGLPTVLLRASAPVLSVYLVVLMGAYEVPLLVGAQYPSMISVLIQRRFSQFDMGTRPEAMCWQAFTPVWPRACCWCCSREVPGATRRSMERDPSSAGMDAVGIAGGAVILLVLLSLARH